MECINHSGIAAAGSCQVCGKALCADCMNRVNPPLCEPCLLAHNGSIAKRLYIDLAITACIFLAVFTTMAFQTPARLQAGILFGVILSCAFWGWQFLSRYSVPLFFISGLGLLVYIGVKFVLSICTGFIVAPWQVIRRIREISSINLLKKQIAEGKV